MSVSHKQSKKRESRIRAGSDGLKSLPVDIHTMLEVEKDGWRYPSIWAAATIAIYFGCIVMRNLRDKAAEITNNPEQMATARTSAPN